MIAWKREDGEYRASVDGINLEVYRQVKTWGWSAIKRGSNRKMGFAESLKEAKARAERAAQDWPHVQHPQAFVAQGQDWPKMEE